MREIPDFNLIQENGEKLVLKAGIYPLRITNVVDVPEKEYLEVYSDITDGEFKNYFVNLAKNSGRDYSKVCRSYKDTALGFFKGFITAVEKSNPGYTWNWDEKSLIGKFVVGVFGEEEYLNKDNEVATIVKLQEIRSLEAYKNGELKVPTIKKLESQSNYVNIDFSKTEETSSDFKLPF